MDPDMIYEKFAQYRLQVKYERARYLLGQITVPQTDDVINDSLTFFGHPKLTQLNYPTEDGLKKIENWEIMSTSGNFIAETAKIDASRVAFQLKREQDAKVFRNK